MDRIARKGFTPLTIPAMAREFSFIGSGQFPKGRDQVYAIEDEDTFLVGTAEVSITGMYKDEILRYEDPPLTFVGYRPCFRKTARTRSVISLPRIEVFLEAHKDISYRHNRRKSEENRSSRGEQKTMLPAASS